MKLKDVIKGLEILSATADREQEITGVSYDSRTTAPGDVFVAISGEAVDGHRFIPMAAEKGAACVVCEHVPEGDIPYVQVVSSRKALALMAGNWFDHPAKEMTMIGVTGTSGKTTSTYLIKSILEQKAGAKVGLVGTIQNMIGDQVLHTERTTPESFELHRLFRQMSDAGCTHVVMEVSSHALALDRVYGIRFAVGIFTNLSQDHLDFHHTMEAYCDAKAILFDRCDVAIYNADDPWHERMLAHCPCRTFSYSAKGDADLSAKNIRLHAGSVEYDAQADTEWAHVHVGIPAIFTVYNTLDAISACWNLGVSIEDCADALAKNHGVKGRMEIIPTPGKSFTILNDYAHKPDALENVLSSVNEGMQWGGVAALNGSQECVEEMKRQYRRRREIIVEGLNDMKGVSCLMPKGAFYAFPNISKLGIPSREFAMRLLKEKHVVVVPGTGFGEGGEGFVRLAYATSEDNIREGLRRMKEFVESL